MTKSPKKSFSMTSPQAQAQAQAQTQTPEDATAVPEQLLPDAGPGAEDLRVNIAPAAARRLSEEGLQRLAAAKSAEANLPGWQSLGKGGKPNHANGRQGPRERKVRW